MSGLEGRHWFDVPLDERVELELTADERDLLREGLLQWGGPTRPTDLIAQAIGFSGVDSLHAEGARIREALRNEEPLTKHDWQRALIALEIVWSSSFYGAGDDWEVVAGGWDDDRTLRTLRELQRKLAGLRAAPRRGHGS